MNRETEATFQRAVIALANLHGWRCYHTHDSRRSAAGFPDLVLVRRDRLIFAEIKSATGRTRPEQEEWLQLLAAVEAAAPGRVSARLWRPRDWNLIAEALA